MRTATKVGAFGAGVTLAFGAAFGAGSALGPVGEDPAPAHAGHDDGTGHDAAPAGGGTATAGDPLPAGLQIAERGYTLQPLLDAPLTAGRETDFRFRILGPDGQPVTRYETEHERDLHLIVVRRDLSGYRHLHPELAADGTWSVPLTFAEPGDHRVLADFTPTGDPAGGLTLGADVSVAGDYEPRPLPAPTRTATVDGYTVTLDGELTPGADSTLTLTVARDGEPVTDLQPYLGALGHLVVLRAGDLAYLHAHPGTDAAGGPAITFHTRAPSAGTYRLYLEFRHGDTVRTAEFTVEAGTPDAAEGAAGGGAAEEHSGDHAH
jgi:hypothetical protein